MCSGDHSLCKGHMKTTSDPLWYAPVSLAEMKALFGGTSGSSCRCVAGDTGRGKVLDTGFGWIQGGVVVNPPQSITATP